MKKVLFATNNPGKIREIAPVFAKMGYQLITNQDLTNPPEVNETGRSFQENSTLKAHLLANYSQLPTIADDSGLMVDYLNGQPGIYSARYAGEGHNDARNNAKLLAELGGVPEEKRTASFKTVIVFSWPGKFDDDLVVTGEAKGTILTVPEGSDGFGYDPLFYVPDKGKTFASMTAMEKNEVSHRGKAIRALVAALPQWLESVDVNE